MIQNTPPGLLALSVDARRWLSVLLMVGVLALLIGQSSRAMLMLPIGETVSGHLEPIASHCPEMLQAANDGVKSMEKNAPICPCCLLLLGLTSSLQPWMLKPPFILGVSPQSAWHQFSQVPLDPPPIYLS